MDIELIEKIASFANDETQLRSAHENAAKALGLNGIEPPLKNGCAATLSSLLISCGVDIPVTLGAGHLAQRLGGNEGKSRYWQRIDVGQQQVGDVGVTYDNTAPPGCRPFVFGN